MPYQRLHLRVPTLGKVILSVGKRIRIEASAIDISAGGLRITAPSIPLDQEEYQIEITTPSRGTIQFSGLVVYQKEKSVGFRISSIDSDNLKIVYQLVEDFQITEDFIRYIGEHDIIDDWFVDDAGTEFTVTFEAVLDEDDEQGDP